MSEIQDYAIWPKETGIEDLPGDLSHLEVTSMAQLRDSWRVRRKELEGTQALNTFSEQLAREWAIETGQIENLYTIERGVTLSLIEKGFSSAVLERGSTNKPPAQVLALINDQKDALEGLFDFVNQNRPLSTSYIKELHAAMTRSQETTDAIAPDGNRVEVPLLRGNWKQAPNYPLRDGKRFLYCPPEQTASEMERLVGMHLSHVASNIPPEVEAAWLHHRFTQIHPFQDGNGRVARALASLVLIRGGMFPMVVPLDEKTGYLDALEAADEGNLRPLVLTIARRQHREHEKANEIVAKLAPDATSIDEAAGALARAIEVRESVFRERLEANEAAACQIVFSQMGFALNRAIEGIRKGAPSARLDSLDAALADKSVTALLRSAGFGDDDFKPSAVLPARTYMVNQPFDWRLILCVLSPKREPHEFLLATASLEVPETLFPPEQVLRISLDEDPSEFTARIMDWSEQVVTSILNKVRHSL